MTEDWEHGAEAHRARIVSPEVSAAQEAHQQNRGHDVDVGGER